MPIPEEERRKRSLLEQALASLQGAGESASRIGKNTAGSIANAIGGGFSDVAGRFGQTAEAAPPPSVRPESIASSEPMGPPDPMDAGPQNSRMGSATLPPRPQPNPPIARMRPGAILPMRGNAQPTDIEGGEPSINRLLSQATSYHEKSPNPDLSSTFDLGSLAPLDNIIKEEPQVADVSNVTKSSFAALGGGDLVDSWSEVKTAQKELGSFSDSAGKWWSVLLAAMFPQYGSALNLIGNMKGNKYRAAMDKYESAYKSLRTPKHDVRGLGDGWYSMDGEIKQLPLDPKSIESEVRYGRTSTGQDVAVSMPKGGNPYHTVEDVDLPFGMGSAPESVLTYDSRLWQQKLADEGKSDRIVEGKENQMELERMRAANREHLQMLSTKASRDLAWLRADLRTFAPQASAAAQAELEDDINFMVEQDPMKKKRTFEAKVTEKAALLKKIQQDEMDRLKGGQPPATPPQVQPQSPTGGQPLKPNFGPPVK